MMSFKNNIISCPSNGFCGALLSKLLGGLKLNYIFGKKGNNCLFLYYLTDRHGGKTKISLY